MLSLFLLHHPTLVAKWRGSQRAFAAAAAMATPASTGNTNSLEESSKHFKKLAASVSVQ